MKEIISRKERRLLFAEEYLKDFNASAAAKRAGYAVKDAGRRGHTLLQDPIVQARLEELTTEIRERNKIEVDDVIAELKKIAFSDMADFYDDDNDIKDVKKMEKNARHALSEYTVIQTPTKKGPKITKRIKLHSKMDALDRLMKYLGGYEKDNNQKTTFSFTHLTDEELMSELKALKSGE